MKFNLKYLLASFAALVFPSAYLLYSPIQKPTIVVVARNTKLTDSPATLLDYKKYDVYHILNTQHVQDTEVEARLKQAKGWQSVDDVEDYQQVYKAIDSLNLKCIDYLLTYSNEAHIENGAKLRAAFQVVHGIRTDIATPFIDKRVMKERLKKHNISQIPFSSDIDHAENTFGFPLVLKPIDKASATGIFVIKDRTALQKALLEIEKKERKAQYIAEKYIHGHDYTINAIVANGEITFVMAVEYLDKCIDFYTKGKSRGSITVNEEEKIALAALVKQVVVAFKLKNGGLFLDCIKDETTGKFLISEVAFRIGVGPYQELVKAHCGVDMQLEGYRAKLGIPTKLSRKDEIPASKILGTVSFPPPRTWTDDEVSIHDVIFEIEDISPTSFAEEFNTFHSYSYAFSKQATLPVKNEPVPYRNIINILLQGSDRAALRRDIKTIQDNFVLTFSPWVRIRKNGVWEKQKININQGV